MMYASTAWGRFITATDIQRVDVFLRHSKCCGFFSPDLPDFGEQLAEYDDRLFNRIHSNSQHVLYSLQPPPSAVSQNYHLRPRRHDRQLPNHGSHLIDCNYLSYAVQRRLLNRQSRHLSPLLTISFYTTLIHIACAVCHMLNKN